MNVKPSAQPSATDDHGYVDLLRLQEHDRRALTQRNPAEAKSGQRQAALSLPGVRAEMTQPAGNTGKYIVYPAELSPTNIAILHGMFVHPNSACTLYFRAADNEPLMMKGKVTSCVHVKGRAHEVVVELENPIDLNLLVPGGAATPATTATAAPETDAAKNSGDAATQLQELAKELAAFAKSLANDQKASAQARQLAARAVLISKSMSA